MGYQLADVFLLKKIGFVYQIILLAWQYLSNDNAIQVDGLSHCENHTGFIKLILTQVTVNYWLHFLPKRMGFKLLKSPYVLATYHILNIPWGQFLSVLYLFFPTSISYTELFQWTIICFLACFIGLFILACLMRMLHSFVSFEHRFSFSCFIWICWILVLSV